MPVKWGTVLPVAALIAVLCSFVSCMAQLKDANGNKVGWQVLGSALSLFVTIPVLIVCFFSFVNHPRLVG